MERLQQRLNSGEVILLDGAIGTELQIMGVPMDHAAWSALANLSHADIVVQMHQDYIRAGADIITTNTFSSARHNLEAAGLGNKVREINLQAVVLAKEAHIRAAGDKPVYIAASLSNYGIHGVSSTIPTTLSQDTINECYAEQAHILAEAGVDFLLLEMVRDLEQGIPLLKAALDTKLPVWVGFSCRVNSQGQVTFLSTEALGRASADPFADNIEQIMSHGGSLVAVMHSVIEDTTPALEVALEKWNGPVGSYPNSGYWKRPNWVFDAVISPNDYLGQAKRWVEMGVQVIGGCCGIGREHIKRLKEGLPSRISPSRRKM